MTRTRRRLTSSAYGLGSLLLGLAAWQFVAASGIVSDAALPPLPEMFEAARDVLAGGSLWQPMVDTVTSAVLGLLLATAIALPSGMLIGYFPVVHDAFKLVVEFLRPIPPPAILPVVVLVLGAGFESKTLLVTFGCVFPILVQSIDGVRSVDPMAVQTARAFRISPVRRFGRILLPAVAPYVFTGVRIAASISLLVAVAVEVIVGAPGLGRSITTASESNQLAVMNVYVVATGVLGIAVTLALAVIQRRTITWQGSAIGDLR